MGELNRARQELLQQRGGWRERLGLLERIDSAFFHRNDERSGSQQNNKERQARRRSAAETPRVLRTLHNMDDLNNTSQCPLHHKLESIQTTLVTHASLNRIRILQETCRRWKDPIVAVVAIAPNDDTSLQSLQQQYHWTQQCPHMTLIPYMLSPAEDESPELYPVNVMRNIGLDAVETSHVLMADVDFVPSDHLQETIRSALLLLLTQHSDNHDDNHDDDHDKHALVVPVFERLPSTPPCTTNENCLQPLLQNSSFIPHDFAQLTTCLKDEDCIVFQSNNNPAGHSSTRSGEWLQKKWYQEDDNDNNNNNKTKTKKLRTLDCFDTARYEPYVVLRWCPTDPRQPQQQRRPVAPYYDERFHGYGKNKIELVQHLRLMGYRFSVLPEGGFMVHSPHVESRVKQRWNAVEDSDLHGDMDRLYRDFLKELVDKYYDEIEKGIVELCTH